MAGSGRLVGVALRVAGLVLAANATHAADEPPWARGLTPDDLVLPAPEARYGSEIALQRILVQHIELDGNTLLDPATVEEIVTGYEGRELAYEDLQELRSRLTQAYIEGGFVNSGVLIPDQEVLDGVVRLTAFEGVLDRIQVSGNQHLRSSFIEKRLRADLGTGFNIGELESSLRLMQQWPLIAQVNGQVLPGAERGESILDLRIRENDPLTVTAGYDNHRSPSVGEHAATAALAHRSLTGNGDYLNLGYAHADGLDDLYAGYGLPVNARDLTIEGYYQQGESDIVEAPFEELDIVSETRTWGARVYQPVVRSLAHTVLLGLTLENEKTESFLLDQAFSFAPGEQVGESEVSVLRLGADWTWRRENDAIALRATLSQGVDWFNATDNSDATDIDGIPVDDLPDSSFTSFLLQSQYARRLPWRSMRLQGRLTAQLVSDPLLPVEKLAIGGARTVRGYRENQIMRDRGLIASLELRAPLFLDDEGESRIGLTLAPFVDYGTGRDEPIGLPGLDNPQSDDLFSAGAGLLWNWWQPLYVEVYYGADLKDAPSGGDGDSWQEDGIHALVNLSWSF